MKIFKTVSMSTYDIGVIKLAIGFIALAVGATWPEVFAPYSKFLFVVGLGAGLYALYMWAKK